MWKLWILWFLIAFLSVSVFPQITRTYSLKPNRNSQNRTIFHQTEQSKYSFFELFAGFSTIISPRILMVFHEFFHQI